MLGLHKPLYGSLLKSKGFLSKLTFERARSGGPFSANHVFTDRVVSEKWPERACSYFGLILTC